MFKNISNFLTILVRGQQICIYNAKNDESIIAEMHKMGLK